jgi:type I restriction-modification system DNA methylase subunit
MSFDSERPTIPSASELIDAAVELSGLLRAAKVEPSLRPKVLGAIAMALSRGEIDTRSAMVLSSIDNLVASGIRAADLPNNAKTKLVEALRLSTSEFGHLAPHLGRAAEILDRLKFRSLLESDVDFFGIFYEAFVRYGYDNNALGIVFTPRHITRFCIELAGVVPDDQIIDVAAGTGGFLVAAKDAMAAQTGICGKPKGRLSGFETNPTVWALANLNMLFRRTESDIWLGSCLDHKNRAAIERRFDRAFLNPPFSQADEPEIRFLEVAMEALKLKGLVAAVVYSGIFADEDHAGWRAGFVSRHSLVAIIGLPEDLFYPTAAPTSIIVAKAHVPQPDEESIFLARIWNDGFAKLKNRRVEVKGSQLAEICDEFSRFRQGQALTSPLVSQVAGHEVKNGAEWSPQQWLPQPKATPDATRYEQEAVVRSVYQAVAQLPQLANAVRKDFACTWRQLAQLPLGRKGTVADFFHVRNGAARGERNYADGDVPYVSSGDGSNSIVRLVTPLAGEVFGEGGITVTAFGRAFVQPWPFVARGNGGSAVRVLLPRFNMSFRELVWFCCQINLQRWRFSYARMAIKSRLERLVIESPAERLMDDEPSLARKVLDFANMLSRFSAMPQPGGQEESDLIRQRSGSRKWSGRSTKLMVG